jgi:hypothetical protein
MDEHKLFEFDWRIAIIPTLFGILMVLTGCAVFLGIINDLLDVPGVFFYLMMICIWAFFVKPNNLG